VLAVCAGVVVAAVDGEPSSSPPQPETAKTSAITTAVPTFALDFQREMPIRNSAESHNADAMDTR